MRDLKEQEWGFLIGYPWEEAQELLDEEEVAYELRLTTPPKKVATWEGARVVALRFGEPLVVICSPEDWTVE